MNMKKIVSALLTAALLLSLAGSALADWTDTPWLGGKDLRQYTNAHPSQGHPARDHPAPRLMQKEPAKAPPSKLEGIHFSDINGLFDADGNPLFDELTITATAQHYIYFTLRGLYFCVLPGVFYFDATDGATLTDFWAAVYGSPIIVQIYP